MYASTPQVLAEGRAKQSSYSDTQKFGTSHHDGKKKNYSQKAGIN